MPILLCGGECFNLSKDELQSLDFTINRLFVKLLNTSNIFPVKDCQYFFGLELESSTVKVKFERFLLRKIYRK